MDVVKAVPLQPEAQFLTLHKHIMRQFLYNEPADDSRQRN